MMNDQFSQQSRLPGLAEQRKRRASRTSVVARHRVREWLPTAVAGERLAYGQLGALPFAGHSTAVGLGIGGLGVRAPKRSAPLSQPKGLLEGFVKTCQRWGLTDTEDAILLGYLGNETGAAGMISGVQAIPSQDVRDRIAFVLEISLRLGAIFNEDLAKERAWLAARRESFQGKSARELLLEGKITDMLMVLRLARSEGEP